MTQKRSTADGWRLPAAELEQSVTTALIQALRNTEQLIDLTQLTKETAHATETLVSNANTLAQRLEDSTDPQHRELLHIIIKRIDVAPGKMQLQLNRNSLRNSLQVESSDPFKEESDAIATISLPFQMRRRGVEARLILNNEHPPSAKPDANLVELIRNVHRWLDQLNAGSASSIDELAERVNIPASEISQTLPLAFLAPDIIKSILLGTHPVDLTAETLKRIGKLPACWQEQRKLLQVHA